MSRLSNAFLFFTGQAAIPDLPFKEAEKVTKPPIDDVERNEIEDRLRNLIGKIGDISKGVKEHVRDSDA